MKSRKSAIWTYLITNKDFRDLVIKHNYKDNDGLEKFIGLNPAFRNEINQAREFIERMTFPKEQLLPHELDEMLQKILTEGKAATQKKRN